MTSVEFDQRQFKKQTELLEGAEPKTQKEKDLWNLKWMRYSIHHGSPYYRMGMISTLDRTIKRLEEDDAR